MKNVIKKITSLMESNNIEYMISKEGNTTSINFYKNIDHIEGNIIDILRAAQDNNIGSYFYNIKIDIFEN
jgi:phosphoenolpyruvate synthase/pyruvate phosphate dikinase